MAHVAGQGDGCNRRHTGAALRSRPAVGVDTKARARGACGRAGGWVQQARCQHANRSGPLRRLLARINAAQVADSACLGGRHIPKHCVHDLLTQIRAASHGAFRTPV